MPWCPNCKAEYQEGFTECKDCKVPLVDKLEELEEAEPLMPFFQAEDQKVAEKLASFFEYSGLHCETHYDEETDCYIIDIPPYMEKDARKLYEAFYVVEAELAMKEARAKLDAPNTNMEETEEYSPASADIEDTGEVTNKVIEDEADTSDESYMEEEETDDELLIDGPSDDISSFEGNKGGDEAVYVMKSDQYNDLNGTVFIFMLFGVGGLIFVILNIANIINVFNGWLPNSVMAALFILFIFIALNAAKKAKIVRSEIDAENLLTKDINNWLKENVTKSFLASIKNEGISDEANYIHQIDTLKEMLIKEFGPQNFAYLDHLIEEFYNENFDKAE